MTPARDDDRRSSPTSTVALRDLDLAASGHRRLALAIPVEAYRQSGVSYEISGGSVDALLYVTRIESGYHLRLAFDAVLSGPCARCLGPARLLVRIDDDEVDDDSAEEGDLDLRSDHLDAATGIIDVASWASEAIALRVPTSVVCRDDCAGLCPMCGIDRNAGSCTCSVDVRDSRWDKLREVTFDGDGDDGV